MRDSDAHDYANAAFAHVSRDCSQCAETQAEKRRETQTLHYRCGGARKLGYDFFRDVVQTLENESRAVKRHDRLVFRQQESRVRKGGEPLVLTGVSIVDTLSGALSLDRSIVIEDGTFATIAPAATFAAPPSARTIEAPRKYVVPGFLDLHAHPLSSSDPEGSLTLLLANGITGFREMAAWGTMLADRRAGTLMPPIDAPELLELASATLTPANAASPEAAIDEVRRQQSEGADFIKIIDYTPDVFEAVASECKRLNIKFLGHLSPTLDARVAVERGMQSIEHLGPLYGLMLSCSTEEQSLRSAAREATLRRPTRRSVTRTDCALTCVSDPERNARRHRELPARHRHV